MSDLDAAFELGVLVGRMQATAYRVWGRPPTIPKIDKGPSKTWDAVRWRDWVLDGMPFSDDVGFVPFSEEGR